MLKQKKIKPTPVETNYEYVGKESLSEIVRKTFPKQLVPTERFATIFGLIFLAVIIIAGIQFPFNQMLLGNVDITVGIGYPWSFLEFDLSDIKASPLRLLNLFFDLILYMTLAYIIDIALNLILESFIESKEKLKQRPVIYKNREPAIAEKIAEKILGKPVK